MLPSIKEVIMERDGLPEEYADCLIAEAKDEIQQCVDEDDLLGAENVIYDYFGLEPDFLMELIDC